MAYVHWYMKTGDKNALRYENALDELKSKAWSGKVQNLMKQRVKQTYGLKTDKDFQKFLEVSTSLLSGKNSDFARGVEFAFKALSKFKSLSQQQIQNLSTIVRNENDLTNLGNKADQLFTIMDDFIDFCANFYSKTEGQDFLAFLIAENNKNKFISDIKTEKLIKSIIDTKEARIFNRTDADLSRGASLKFKEINTTIKSMKNSNFKNYVIQEYKNQTGERKQSLGTIINAYYTNMSSIAGFMYETLLDTFLNVKIIELMKKNAPKNVQISSASAKDSLNNTDSKFTFRKPTVDLKIGVDGGQINFKLPIGLSVKRSTKSTNNKIDISIKNSSLGKLLELSRNYGLWNEVKHGEAFYNIIANHRRHASTSLRGGGGGSYYYYKNKRNDEALSPIFNLMNKMFLIFGLAGSLTKDDLATYILVNNRAYSIYEILSKIDLPETVVGGLTNKTQMNIRSKHRFYYIEGESGKDTTPSIELAKKRTTDLIIDNIFKQQLHMTLNLNLKKINLKHI